MTKIIDLYKEVNCDPSMEVNARIEAMDNRLTGYSAFIDYCRIKYKLKDDKFDRFERKVALSFTPDKYYSEVEKIAKDINKEINIKKDFLLGSLASKHINSIKDGESGYLNPRAIKAGSLIEKVSMSTVFSPVMDKCCYDGDELYNYFLECCFDKQINSDDIRELLKVADLDGEIKRDCSKLFKFKCREFYKEDEQLQNHKSTFMNMALYHAEKGEVNPNFNSFLIRLKQDNFLDACHDKKSISGYVDSRPRCSRCKTVLRGKKIYERDGQIYGSKCIHKI